MSFEWSCNCPDFAQNMHDLHQEAKHTSLFCLVFLRPSLGLWRYVASDFKTFNRGRVFESYQSKDTPDLFNPHKSLFLGIPRVHIRLCILEASALKDVESAAESKVQGDCWLAPGSTGSEKHNSSSMLLYAPLHLKCSSRGPVLLRISATWQVHPQEIISWKTHLSSAPCGKAPKKNTSRQWSCNTWTLRCSIFRRK